MNATVPLEFGTATETSLVADSRAVLSKHARTFRWAGALLPKSQLDSAAIIYAFCRLVDDIADETPDPNHARKGLEYVTATLEHPQPTDPLIAASKAVLSTLPCGVDAARHLMTGVTSDLDTVRLTSDEQLYRYCYQVAGTVGLMMCAVLGVRDPEAWAFAVDLGVAMQLTNICRDVLEDAERGRVYIPLERLESVGLTGERLVSAAQDERPLTLVERRALQHVVTVLLLEAETYYQSAHHGMRFIPWRARFAIRVASRVYRAIGIKLIRNHGNSWDGRTFIPTSGKVWWTLRAGIDFIQGLIQPARPHDPTLHAHLFDLPGCGRPS